MGLWGVLIDILKTAATHAAPHVARSAVDMARDAGLEIIRKQAKAIRRLSRELRRQSKKRHMLHDRPEHWRRFRITIALRRAIGDLFLGPYRY